jgi:hypothetical protein
MTAAYNQHRAPFRGANARGVETGLPEPTERVPLNLIEIILAQGSKSVLASL